MLAREPAKRLMSAGTWESLAPGDLLTREGEVAPKIRLVAAGQVDVTLGGDPITCLRPGQFVGDPLCRAGSPPELALPQRCDSGSRRRRR